MSTSSPSSSYSISHTPSWIMLTVIALVSMMTTSTMADGSRFLSSDDLVEQIVRNQTLTQRIDLINANSTSTSTTAIIIDPVFDVIFPNNNNNNNNNNGSDKPQRRPHIRNINLIRSFPADFMSDDFRHRGGFVVHLCIYVYLCMLLTVIIDSYFLLSLQYFSLVFKISPNISGATLMALGTSSPEFFASIFGVFIADNTIATGAIVGSTIVNTLAIPGVCGLAVIWMRTPPISSQFCRFPIVRDLIFYAITVIIFVQAIQDGAVDCLESLAFIFVYLIYIFTLYLWGNIRMLSSHRNRALRAAQRLPIRKKHRISLQRIASIESGSGDSPDGAAGSTRLVSRRRSSHSAELLQKSPVSVANLLEDNRYIRYALAPLLPLVRLSIPRPNKHFFMLTFALCCVWIAGITYLNLWMVSLIGDALRLPEAVSGMTIFAIGTNIPELISSFILVRKYGQTNVAICHTLGSNIFDILICLGLPWFLQMFALTISSGAMLDELGQRVIPLEPSLLYFVYLALLLPILLLSAVLCAAEWQLTPRMGAICISAYAAFIVIVIALQVNSMLT